MDSVWLLWEIVLVVVQVALIFWPISLLVSLMALVRVGIYLYQQHRYAKAGIVDIDKLSGKEFEQYLEVFFKQLGYQVRRTPYQGDYGADLILQQAGVKTVMQAKRYHRQVGVKAVQEVVAAKGYYHCDKALVVTNSSFSRQAQGLAHANGVELWDRETLVTRLLAKIATVPAAEVASTALQSEDNSVLPPLPASMIPTCATCGKQVSAKVHAYCVAHAERFHGRTYCYDHQKELRRMQPA